MKRLAIILFLATVFTGLCAAQSQLRNFHQEGPASQDIATQELTAAHPSLPLGTQVRVTNPRNGKQTTVRITGRIPATEGRIVDLSKGAASALELPAQGRAPVVLEIVPATRQRTPPPVDEAPPPPPPPPEEPKEEPKEEPPPPPEEPKEEPKEEPAKETPGEEQPLLPPHEDPSKDEQPAAPQQEPGPETEFVPGADPQAPSVNTTDTKNQTTAPVSAQSPNITIYNVLQSPNSFATDSAPVNAEGGGQAPITAAAPTASVSRSDSTNTTTTTTPAASGENKPAVATATAQIVAPQQQPEQPQAAQRPPQQQPTQPQQPPQASQRPPQQPPQQPAQPQAAQRPPQQQPTQPQQPPEASPLPPMVDRGTALIKPYMPNSDNGKVYRVQVGSYQNTWHAKEAFDRLTTVGFQPAYERYGDYIRVIVPGVPAGDMPAVARLLGRVGFTEALIREEN